MQTEEEQIAQLKEWWQRNGKPLLAGGVLAVAGVFGWQYWQNYQASQAAAASYTYQQLLENVLSSEVERDTAEVVELSNKLKSEFAGSPYSQYGALLAAKLAVEAGKLDDAAAELQAVVDKPADATLGELARQRLARVLAAQDKAEEGLTLLDGEAPASYQASREELRGDLLKQLQRPAEAREAYQKARAVLADDAAQGTLQLKLDDLAEGDA
ncbi:GTP-binding protein [Pseudomonas fluvialis]|uniref:GTP-binding protein n=1 Tax=Pseudomonas fluvialis TaxID=1793966 RepID=A0A2I0CQ67_9PSED|nr:tetratricopeptide repeat protein [Pseudomonas pharmacofabricae]PKF71291.1 GTP-binding protein [Pseudomonas pharmacofabricae]